MFLVGGEEFVGKHPTQEIVNGFRHSYVLGVCGILAGLIPITLLRYSNTKFLRLYLPISIVYYFIIMLLMLYAMG